MSKELTKQYRIILIAFIAVIALSAQSCGRTYYIFGALTKSNLYAYDPNDIYNNQGGVDWYPKLGAQIGVATTVADISKKFSFRTEVYMSYQGAKYEDVSNSVKGSINLLYTYVPLIVRYRHNSGFYGEAGIQPGLLISARDRIGGSSSYFNDYIKNLDFGMTVRLGYEFNDKFSLGLSGYLGFINISEAKIDAKNNTSISVIGTYTLKKHP
jgi:Outer membrane protein beta-barrel domain